MSGSENDSRAFAAPQTFHVDSESALDPVANQIAQQLDPGDTVGLIGTLGAGKTRLVQAIAAALGVERSLVVSPTFTLCNEYQGQSVHLHHLDLYRIVDDDDLLELGLDEYCHAEGITLIEWADRFLDALPHDRIEIRIDVLGPERRRIEVKRCNQH